MAVHPNKYTTRLAGLLANVHFSSFISNLVFSVGAFFSFIVLSRNIPPHVFGSWVLFLSFASFMDMIIMGLTRNAVIYYGCGSDETNRHIVNASSLVAMLIILAIMTLLFLPFAVWGGEFIPPVWRGILFFYPLVGLSGIWRTSSLSFLQAKAMYHKTIVIRLINTLLFLLACIILVYTHKVSFLTLVLTYLGASLASSLYGIYRGWDSMKYIRRVTREQVWQVLNYGKYTLFTNLGSSLLKSADIFIIGLSPVLGVVGVAVYSIPFKLVEVIEIPLRSLAMSSFNRISILHKEKDFRGIGHLFVRYNLVLFILFIPMMLFLVLFPHFILSVLGGDRYTSYMPTMVTIIYIIVVYGFLMIPDRLIGVTLEGIGFPKGNTIKTLLMMFLNVIGNLIAVFYFQSLVGVAVASIAFTLLGVIVGSRFISRSPVVLGSGLVRTEWKRLTSRLIHKVV